MPWSRRRPQGVCRCAGASSRASRCPTTSSARARARSVRSTPGSPASRPWSRRESARSATISCPCSTGRARISDWPLPTGATALRFDQARFAAFDLYVLKRAGAESDYDDRTRRRAKAVADALSEDDAAHLTRTIAAGLPGTTTEALDLDGFRARLAAYRGIDADRLRRNLVAFLALVAPVAERLGARLTLHPDDPPRPLFGLPRIASTAPDYAALFAAVPSPANGMCFCTGSLGVRADNDLPAIAKSFAERIHFVHLRATKRDTDGESFHEADHLDGDVDMVAVLKVLLAEDTRRKDGEKIPFRPDHGHRMLHDLDSDRRVNPGYTAVGRLKGLAELRGIIRALDHRGAAA